MKYGLALAGGGTRGAAHVGVLKALDEEHLLPSSIAGTSAGSIVAGLFASGMSIPEMCNVVTHLSRRGLSYLDPDYKNILKLLPQMICKKTVTLTGLLKGNKLAEYLCELTRNQSLSDINIKTVIPAVDIESGDTIVFTNFAWTYPLEHVLWKHSGKLCEIMMASSSVPAIFQPRKLETFQLVDGGVTNNLPVDLLAAADEKRIIAVDLGDDYKKPPNNSIFEVSLHAFSIMSRDLKDCLSQKELLLLKPSLPAEAGLLTFEYMTACMEAGYQYTKNMIPRIREVLSEPVNPLKKL